MHADHKYIEALRNHDTRTINELYRLFAPGIKRYLLSKGADEEAAGDIFQEALIDIYKLAHDGKFELSCPFEAFLLLICKRKWINAAKKKEREGVTKSTDALYTVDIADKEQEQAAVYADSVDKERLVMQLLDELSERCKEIIIASYANKSQELLSQQMGISYAYLRKKKSVCMSELINLAKTRQLL